MNEIVVEEYLKKKKLTSIPEIQKEFDLKYKEVYDFFSKLLQQGKIILEDDLHFSYIEKEEEDDVPEIYKKVLWSCIKNGKASFSYIQKNFSLPSEKINEILDWMKEDHYIASFSFLEQNVLIDKDQFIELFGYIEEDEDSIEDEISDLFIRTKPKSMRDLLNTRRSDLIKRIKDCETKIKLDFGDINNLETEEDDFDITKYCDILKVLEKPEENSNKSYYDIIEKIVLVNKEISQKDFLTIIEKILKNSIVSDTWLEAIYKDVFKNVSNMTEEQFQEIKDIIVD